MGGIVDSKDIGSRIRQFRQDAGLSQEALAELVGVSFQQVQKYESGHTTLNILKLQHIADALKVQVTDFFSSTPVQHVRLTGEEDLLLQAFRKVKNAEMRGCVLKLVGNINKRIK
jgi:transcriptional regulator with XRE-family HTH domain